MHSPFFPRARAYAVHLLTASGVVAAFLAVAELLAEAPDERVVFAWLVVAVVLDAVDGPLARAWDVKRLAPDINGRTIDDIVDLPHVHVHSAPARVADGLGALRPWRSRRGVDRARAGGELARLRPCGGQGRGGGVLPRLSELLEHRRVLRRPRVYGLGETGQWLNGVVLLALAALSVAPVRFLYPNLTPRPWKLPVLLGAAGWLAVLLGMLFVYRQVPGWVVGVSLIYPAFYATLSILIDPRRF
jgi:phosphatidylcholine synthase